MMKILKSVVLCTLVLNCMPNIQAAEIILKKLSANIYDQLYHESDGSIKFLKTSGDGSFKYLNLQLQFNVKLKDNERLRLEKKNTFLEDSKGNKHTSIQMCFPNNIGRNSFTSLYNSFDKDDTKDLHSFNLAFRIPANESVFIFHLDKIKKKIKAKVHKNSNIAPITSFASFKLLKTEILTSISDKDYKGRVNGKSLYIYETYKAPAGNKLLAVTFAISPKKAFDSHGVKKFIMPRFSIRDKNTHGQLIGHSRNNSLDTNPRFDSYLKDGKWQKGEITAVFSVPKSLKDFELTAFGTPFLKGRAK